MGTLGGWRVSSSVPPRGQPRASCEKGAPHEVQVGEGKVGGEAHEEGDSDDGSPINAVESLPEIDPAPGKRGAFQE